MFLSTPLLLALIEGQTAVIQSNERLTTMPGLMDLPPLNLFFVSIALVGFGVARLLRLPMPHLLGPMGLSITAHLSGFLVCRGSVNLSFWHSLPSVAASVPALPAFPSKK